MRSLIEISTISSIWQIIPPFPTPSCSPHVEIWATMNPLIAPMVEQTMAAIVSCFYVFVSVENTPILDFFVVLYLSKGYNILGLQIPKNVSLKTMKVQKILNSWGFN